MLSLRRCAGLFGLALLVAACAQPTTAPTAMPEPTAEPVPTEMLATEAPAVAEEPTVPAEMVEPQPDDGSPDAEPAPEGGAEPAVQLIAMTGPDDIRVGREAQLAVLTGDSDGVDRVELQIDGQVVSTLTANQATEFQGVLSWTPDKEGDHNAVVIVFDKLGLPGQAEQRTVTVLPGEPTTAPPATGAPAPPPTNPPPTPMPAADRPAVSITPLNPRIEPGQDFQIATNAVSDAGIVRLELFMNDRLVDTWRHDEASGPPSRSVYRTLHMRNARQGQYDAFVRAFAADGQVGQSVTERVRARPPAEVPAEPTDEAGAPGDEQPTEEPTAQP